MTTTNRWVSLLVAAGYLLAVSTASLFHNHSVDGSGQCSHGHSSAHEESAECHHGGDCPDLRLGGNETVPFDAKNTPKSPAPCPSDDSDCSVCQFLAQKPAPTAEVAPVASGTLVQVAILAAPASITVGVFSAWHSRAPPAIA